MQQEMTEGKQYCFLYISYFGKLHGVDHRYVHRREVKIHFPYGYNNDGLILLLSICKKGTYILSKVCGYHNLYLTHPDPLKLDPGKVPSQNCCPSGRQGV